MKSVFLVSQDHDLYRQVEDVVVGEGATASSDKVVQLRDDEDRLLTVYGNLNAPDYDDVRQPAEGFRGAGEAPDLLTVTACVVECRWGGDGRELDCVHRDAPSAARMGAGRGRCRVARLHG